MVKIGLFLLKNDKNAIIGNLWFLWDKLYSGIAHHFQLNGILSINMPP
jgi:hypothetical protein